ncbi:autotransporter domain-containing protein [Polaromonas sp.]|uniref:autotransporter domain-containing protein n=1 Tax=Polaromonas sp. TaxID=1869339 RepID=UPI0032663926
MNTTHRSIWNAALGAWVAVSEITRACGKRSSGAAVALVLIGSSVCSSVGAQDVYIDGASVTVPVPRTSPWNIGGALLVGYTGTGTLTVSAGGTVSNLVGHIGYDSGSTGNVTVTGVNSNWTNTDRLYVGFGGTGTLTVQDGGTVSNTFVNLGVFAGAIGNATVTGAGSTWTNSANLTLGTDGAGTLTVANAGHVSVNSGTGVINVGSFAGSTGVLNIGAAAASPAQAAGTVAAGELRFGAGTGSLNFNHTDTAYTFSPRITGAGVVNHYAGTTILSGANTYSGATAINGGTLRAGAANTLSGSSAVTLANTAGATLDLNNFSQTIGSLAGGGTTGGDVTLGSGTLTAGGNNSSTSFGGVISGTGAFTKTGAGNLILTGANTYSGGTTINGGTLRAGAANTLAGSSAVTVADIAGATLDLNNFNQTVGSLAGGGAAGGNVTLGSGTLTAGGNNSSTSFGGVISGSGAFSKTGAGNLILTGVNTYSGGTTVSGGILQGNSISLQGNITNNAAVTFNQATAGTYAGVMSGTGAFTKTGTGNLILTNTNTYSGGTTVSGGALQGNSTSLQGNILNNADVIFAETTAGTYAGAMSGTGNLTKIGAGVLGLSGANTYTGGTTVTAGTLQGDTTSLQGNIINNTAVIFSQAATGTYAGQMSGTGFLNKTGAGTLVLTGANTYSGGTTVSGGILQGSSTSLQGNILNNAAVTFDQASVGTYASAMSGTGSLTKQGAGNLILSGTNTYSGATNINAGTLSVNGSIGNSAVTVNNGGILGGNGTLGNTTIASGGVLAPGNSIGTLTVNGNLNFAAGSIYRVEVDAAGANDRINASGTATITGGTVDVQAGAGTYAANTTYTILNAAGGRTGNFAGVTSNLAFLTPTLGYDANNVFLTLARNDISFASIAITPNQIATSTALQNANAGATGDMAAVQTALTGLSAAQARAAYDATSGAGLVALRNAGASFAAGFGRQLQARLGAVQGGEGGGLVNSFSNRPVLLAANDRVSDLMAPVSDSAPQKFSLAGGASSPSSSPDANGKGLWVRGYGGYGNTGSDGNAAASQLRSIGLSIGFDAEVKDGVRVGIAATGGASRLSTDNNETGKARGSAVAVYGSYAAGPWNLSGSASMGWVKNHLDRNVVVGALNRVASSDFDSNTLAVYGEASYSIAMNGWMLQPLAGLSLSRNKADGFTETGAGALNLQVAGQTVTSTKSLLGAKAGFETGSVHLEPRVIWAHEFGDLNMPMTAQFQGAATAAPFQVSGAALKRDTLILGLGASGRVGHGVDLFADVQLEHNQRQRNLSALMGVRVRW